MHAKADKLDSGGHRVKLGVLGFSSLILIPSVFHDPKEAIVAIVCSPRAGQPLTLLASVLVFEPIVWGEQGCECWAFDLTQGPSFPKGKL